MERRSKTGNVVWIAVATCLIVMALLAGDWIRNSIGQPMRFALCVTGAALFGSSTLAYIVSPARPFHMSASSWVKIMGSAALVGFLIFILFVQDIECELRSSGRGISTACKEIGS